MTTSFDAVVLAGGAARRLGGADKPALPLGGRMLLDRVLGACAGARSTVVVGPRRPTVRQVLWTREEPPGGGPLPALAAGLAALGAAADLALLVAPADRPAAAGTAAHAAGPGSTPAHAAGPEAPGPAPHGPQAPRVVVVLAADLPFIAAETVRELVRALDPQARRGSGGSAGGPAAPEGVVLTDPGGRDQPLAAAYRVEPLRRELALLRAEHGRLAGLPLRMLTGELVLARVADAAGDASFDCDTWEDVARARARLDAEPSG